MRNEHLHIFTSTGKSKTEFLTDPYWLRSRNEKFDIKAFTSGIKAQHTPTRRSLKQWVWEWRRKMAGIEVTGSACVLLSASQSGRE